VQPQCSCLWVEVEEFLLFYVKQNKVQDCTIFFSCVLHVKFYIFLKVGSTSFCKVQGGSNMTGTDLCVNKPHKSRSYLNHHV
jgi:hypothetical protein